MTPFRALLSSPALAATVSAILLGTGCNFILNPAKSDEVIRCKNTTECEQEPYFFDALNTNRFDASCGAPNAGGGGDVSSSKTNQVCSIVDKVSVSCDPDVFAKGPFYDAWERANANANAYSPCTGDKLGTLGCAPTFNGACTPPLEANPFGVCDDTDDKTPLLYAPTSAELFGQDVKDQHCRSYFCDDAFVCDSGTNRCTRCSASTEAKDLGEGACAELALQGQRSTVYQDAATLKAECQDPSEAEMTAFGPPVVFTPVP